MTDTEKAPYHKIMVAAWRIFIKDREAKQYSDKWWEEILREYEKLREPYKGTELDDYVCQLNQVFLEQYERLQKHGRQKGISEELLSNQNKSYTQNKLQCSNPVCEMGGSKEDSETLSAADW